MKLTNRLARIEASRLPDHTPEAGAAVWKRLEEIQARLLESGDDLAFKPEGDPVENFVRAVLRDEFEKGLDELRAVLARYE
jgi:hypothetical protein